MRVGFVGAGKVGFSLGRFFADKGIHVTGYFSRHIESAREAAAFTKAKAFMSLEDLVEASDAIFLTVPDGEICSTYMQIAAVGIHGKQICHCSGALCSMEAFPDIADSGAKGYSIHPLFPVSDKLTSFRKLQDAFFCIEGTDDEGVLRWKQLLENMGLAVRVIESESKVKYHAACVMASNLVCGLFDESIMLLSECGFDEKLAVSAISALAKTNLEAILSKGPVLALTGPVERNDAATVKKHIECLDEAQKEFYKASTRRLIETAKKKHPGRDYSELMHICE